MRGKNLALTRGPLQCGGLRQHLSEAEGKWVQGLR